MEKLDAVIVGGGQAGVSLSYFLQSRNISHVVLEKDRAFSAWHSRWDAFRLNTANWMNVLPGFRREFVPGANQDRTANLTEALEYFKAYLLSTNPHLRERTQVLRVFEKSDSTWLVSTTKGEYQTPNVAICTGQDSEPRLPEVASHFPDKIPHIHSSEYRNPSQVETRNVLVVGSGSSGIQICEDLAKSDRFEAIHLSVSSNFVIPWEILDVPIGAIVRHLNVFDVDCGSWIGKRFCLPTGRGDPAMAPSPDRLKKKYGIRLVGRVTNLVGNAIESSDGHSVPLTSLTVIWCTGFSARYGFLHVRHKTDVFNRDSRPKHLRGVVQTAPGLYFIGLRFQQTVSSHLLHGVGRDAAYIAEHIRNRLCNLKVPSGQPT